MMQYGMMQSSDSCLGEQFLRSEQEQEQEHGENQTVKTKKAPLREGPNWNSHFY